MSLELQTFLVGASPLFELRGAIPLALGVYKLPVWSAYLFAVLGNLIPIFAIPFWGKASDWLARRSYFFNRFFAWLFSKTRRDHERRIELYKEFALVLLVAVPLPFTGAWTGSLVAFLFGIPLKKAFPLIAFGVIMAGIIVTLLTRGFLLQNSL